jgi:hypothetical protein
MIIQVQMLKCSYSGRVFVFYLCVQGLILAICSCLIIISPQTSTHLTHVRKKIHISLTRYAIPYHTMPQYTTSHHITCNTIPCNRHTTPHEASYTHTKTISSWKATKADLPESRVTSCNPPFTYTGVDCFRPFYVWR